MTSLPANSSIVTTRRIIGQGALLFGGYGLMQACSLARNILIAGWLSKGDFGIAATILLVLQLVETMSDLGADRLIVQAEDGDDPNLMANIHATLIARGLVSGLLLYLLAAPTASFFRITEAQWAFEAIALVPVIKGFAHLDVRRRQRTLNNAPFMLSETAPQVAALLLAWPILIVSGRFGAAVWVALAQAVISVVMSHVLAERSYRLACERIFLERIVVFGWPIWLSAFPLIAVYYVDRAIVGRMFGMEELAGYAAAFMLAMVPALIAAKVAHALMLPLLVSARAKPDLYASRYAVMTELVSVAASLYAIFAIVSGNVLLELAFGARYAGHDTVLAWLALMWALRMIQSVPGMAILATGRTRPLLYAGMIRASSLLLALWAAHSGFGVEGIAAAGTLGEFASLIYVAYAAGRREASAPSLASAFLLRSAFLAPVALTAAAFKLFEPDAVAGWLTLPAALVLASATLLLALAAMPGLRAFVEQGRRALELARSAPAAPAPGGARAQS